MKAETIFMCLGLCAVVLLTGCASQKSQNQYSWNYDPNNADKLAPTLPLDPEFPSGPVPIMPTYYGYQTK